MPKPLNCSHWKTAEKLASECLNKEFGQSFSKQKLNINGKPWEFDFVSDDKKIIAQVKFCEKKFENLTDSQIITRFKRGYGFDCLLLEKAHADKKFFFLVGDKKLFDKYKDWSRGLFQNIDLRFINAW